MEMNAFVIVVSIESYNKRISLTRFQAYITMFWTINVNF